METIKQYLAAAMHVQTCQEFLYYGARKSPPLTAGECAKFYLAHAKKSENQRRRNNLVDAAASKGLIFASVLYLQLIPKFRK